MSNIVVERQEHKLILKNSHLQLEFDLNSGFFDIKEIKSSKKILVNAYAEVEISDGTLHNLMSYFKYNQRKIELKEIEDRIGKGKKIRIVHTEHPHQPQLCLDIYLYENYPYIILQITLKNTLNFDFRVNSLSPLVLSSEEEGKFIFKDFKDLYFYKQGWQSWSPAYTLRVGEKEAVCWIGLGRRMLNYDEKRKSKKDEYLSEFMTLLGDKNSTFIFGFISFSNQFSAIEFKTKKFLFKTVSYNEGILLEREKEVFSEKLLIGFNNSPVSLVSDYAEIVKKEMDVKIREKVPTGWCSWYYYFRNIDEEKILKNLEIVKDENLPLEYFQIDDGYQKEIGDWLKTNEKFKNGMKFIADKIKEKGFKPGIWVAPFIVRKNSEICKKHPYWVLCNEKGKEVVAGFNPLWGGFYYALDLTHPEVIEYIKEIFRTITKEWGYQFVKIDFVFAAALAGKHYNSSLTRCQIYRQALSAIRETVGEETFILGCGAPLSASVGIVDGNRISTDVEPRWVNPLGIILGDKFIIGARNSIWNTLTRFFFHKNFWLNDPDCLLVRKDRNKLKDEEIKSLATVIGLSGGMVLSSDNFQTLTEDRKKLILLLLPSHSYSAKTLDFLEKSFPQVFIIESEKWKLLSISNWENSPKNIEIPFEKLGLQDFEYHFFEFWDKKYYKFKDKIIIKNLLSHTTKLFIIKEDKKMPQVLASNFHITGPLRDIKEEYFSETLQELYFEVESINNNEGEIFVYIPDKYKIKEIWTSSIRWDKEVKENILKISLKLKEKVYFKIKFTFQENRV